MRENEAIEKLFEKIKVKNWVKKITTDCSAGFETESEMLEEDFEDVESFVAGANLILEAIKNGYIEMV